MKVGRWMTRPCTPMVEDGANAIEGGQGDDGVTMCLYVRGEETTVCLGEDRELQLLRLNGRRGKGGDPDGTKGKIRGVDGVVRRWTCVGKYNAIPSFVVVDVLDEACKTCGSPIGVRTRAKEIEVGIAAELSVVNVAQTRGGHDGT